MNPEEEEEEEKKKKKKKNQMNPEEEEEEEANSPACEHQVRKARLAFFMSGIINLESD
jgi:hypothetical protein